MFSKVALLLPHEVLHKMAQRADSAVLHSQEDLSPLTKEHLQQTTADLGLDKAVAIGLWADGMPFNSDRSQSVEAVSWYLPGRH